MCFQLDVLAAALFVFLFFFRSAFFILLRISFTIGFSLVGFLAFLSVSLLQGSSEFQLLVCSDFQHCSLPLFLSKVPLL